MAKSIYIFCELYSGVGIVKFLSYVQIILSEFYTGLHIWL